MNNKPETWARAEGVVFTGGCKDALETGRDREQEEPFLTNSTPERAPSVTRASGHLLFRALKTV